ncbi:hypothetical protein [Vibrio campbellii]|uniref:hypothetical protein n=1 Tax=Vibrio campbellii TaxID=680 RepID=UPI002108F533|nr:hypothetical protein [Vibrio campbellii]UTZ44802.1 hypothetical protein HB764_26465 [Vibrio campbellii]
MTNTKPSDLDMKNESVNKNEPRDYLMLVEKRILGRWHEKGKVITLTPSQAEYHLRNKILKLKVSK